MTEKQSFLSSAIQLPNGQQWNADILWLHVGSNSVIAFAYLLIPIALMILATKIPRKFPHKDLLYLFITFIFLCGVAHIVEIYSFWKPIYHIEGWANAIAASASIVTALVLLSKLPELLSSHSLKEKYASLEENQKNLEFRLSQMNALYEASLGREERIVQLKKEINEELSKQGQPPRYRIHEN